MTTIEIANISQSICEFLCEEILQEDIELDLDDNLLTELDIDSLGMLRLVGFVESEYQIKIPPIFFTIENFRSINTVSFLTHNILRD
jgi:acyl carrier protein